MEYRTQSLERIVLEYRSLGRTGVKVSSLCLGCMMFGARTSLVVSVSCFCRLLTWPVSASSLCCSLVLTTVVVVVVTTLFLCFVVVSAQPFALHKSKIAATPATTA